MLLCLTAFKYGLLCTDREFWFARRVELPAGGAELHVARPLKVNVHLWILAPPEGCRAAHWAAAGSQQEASRIMCLYVCCVLQLGGDVVRFGRSLTNATQPSSVQLHIWCTWLRRTRLAGRVWAAVTEAVVLGVAVARVAAVARSACQACSAEHGQVGLGGCWRSLLGSREH